MSQQKVNKAFFIFMSYFMLTMITVAFIGNGKYSFGNCLMYAVYFIGIPFLFRALHMEVIKIENQYKR